VHVGHPCARQRRHLQSTTILEIDPGHQPTGRTVVLPNSVFLSAKVFNETLHDDLVVHVVTAGP